ncbi:MAG: hypothetical protein HY867_05745 [Chloroflexi bacterium]|nr:hypothetical protein [Chloroflexota bacterium]
MRRARLPVGFAAAGLVLGLGACRPIFVIGLGELLVLVALASILLVPLLLRLRGSGKRRKK